MAIMMRWRRPPESSCGYALARRTGSGMPTRRMRSSARSRARRPRKAQVHLRAFGDLVADPHDGVERGHRLLEDHRDRPSANLSEPAGRCRHEILALEQHLAADDLAGAGEEAHDRAQRHALAAARLADEPERLAGPDRERHPLDRVDRSAGERELDPQVAHVEERRRVHSGRSRSASPSPISESPSPVMTTATPGMVLSCHFTVMNVCPSAIIVPQSGVGGWMPRPR